MRRKHISGWLLKRLSRVTSSGRFVPEIDGLRFIAIMSVVVFHTHALFWKSAGPAWWAGVGTVVNTGWFGVELFFVISGFILSMPFAEQHLMGKGKVSLRKYFVRRLTRLEPPYVINLLFMLGLLVFIRGKDFAELLPHFLASLVYSHNRIYGEGSAINYVAWSLEVEVQFYILAPVLSLVFLVRSAWVRRTGIGVAMGLIQLAVGGAAWLWPEAQGRLWASLAGKLPFFLVGFLLADVYLVNWRSAPRKSYGWDLIGVAAWSSIPVFLLWDTIWVEISRQTGLALPGILASGWLPLNTVGFASLLLAYMAAFRGRVLNRFFAYPWVAGIGGMCYTIYLYHHMALLDCFGGLIRPDPSQELSPLASIGQIVLLSAIVVACASVFFVLFEKPFMYRDWPQRVKGLAGALGRRAGAVLRGPAPVAEAVPVDDPPGPDRSGESPSSGN